MAVIQPPFVPVDFDVPTTFVGPGFRLVPLGPQHNDADHRAWSHSMEHIRATPGFAVHPWPHEMSAAQNLRDLAQHAEDFVARTGFTYTVLPLDPSTTDEVIGCVYIYPNGASDDVDASVRSWVRADHAHLDAVLWGVVSGWLADTWPFGAIDYAPRAQSGAEPARRGQKSD